jgi:hypothetical protein
MEVLYPGLGAHHCHRCVNKSASHRRQFRDIDNSSLTSFRANLYWMVRLFLVRLLFLHSSEVILFNIEFAIHVLAERNEVRKILQCNTWSTDEFVAGECDAVLVNEGCVWP